MTQPSKQLLITEFELIRFSDEKERFEYVQKKLSAAGFNMQKAIHSTKGAQGVGFVFTQK